MTVSLFTNKESIIKGKMEKENWPERDQRERERKSLRDGEK